MKYKEARQLVRDNMEVTAWVISFPWAYARVEATIFGHDYWDVGFAKYRLSDAKQGLPWSGKKAQQMVVGRAVKRIAKRVMRFQVLQIDVTVTGAKLEEREDGKSYVVPELAKVEA